VIVRPRALPWDLLLTRGPGSLAFREIFRDEAPRAVRAIHHELETWAADGDGEVLAAPTDGGHYLRCRLGQFAFVACLRQPGKAYEPHLFSDPEEAQQAALALLAVVHPPQSSEQEIYFNTQHFGKLGTIP